MIYFRELKAKEAIPGDKLDWYYKQILQDKPLGSWPPCNFASVKEMLKPAYDKMKGT